MSNQLPEIIFEAGGGGNHVRWLLSVHPEFNHIFCPEVDKRVDWICKNVYTNRSWNNWLSVEWKYRQQLNNIFKIDYSLVQPGESFNDPDWQQRRQLIILYDNINIMAMHYFMVNIGLNNQTLDVVIKGMTEWQDDLIKARDSLTINHKMFIISDCLAEKNLDRDWYNKVIAWAGYTDCYDQANQVQQQYYQTRKIAMQDFINYFTGPEFKQHLDFYQQLLDSDK